MKKLLIGILMMLSFSVFAEPSFQQIQSLIEQKNYSAAEQGLIEIIQNHPKSAKAFYAMAQAQAGLGHQDKAKLALDKAQGLDPGLSFATKNNVENLREAIKPQVDKIEVVTESHFWRSLFIVIMLGGIGYFMYWFFTKKKESDEFVPPSQTFYEQDKVVTHASTGARMRDSFNSISSHSSFSPKATPPKPINYQSPVIQSTSNIQQPQVVNNYHNDGPGFGTGMLAGAVIGNMMSNSGHHDHTTIIERDVIREVSPSSRIDTTWDEPVKSTKVEKSWEPESSNSRRDSSDSSWDSGSSSSSSSDSSWDSGSSSSSSSDSSWDSGSSSSSSSDS